MITRLLASDLLRPDVEVIIRVKHDQTLVSVERNMGRGQVMVASRLLDNFQMRMAVQPERMFEDAVMSQLEIVVCGKGDMRG